MIGLFPGTPRERRSATELASRWGPDAVLVDGAPGPALRRSWSSLDAVVLFLPVGAAVRLISPLLRDEHTDPEVVCVDGRFAVTVSGGAQAVADRVAEVLGRVPVVTTGAAPGPLDELLELLSATAEGDLAGCAAAIADGEPVLLSNPHGFPLPALPANVAPDCADPQWTVVVDDRRSRADLGERSLRLVPRTLVVGVGSVRGVSRTAVTGLISRLDREHGLDPRAIRAFATAKAKADEHGILEAVKDLGFWHSADAEELPLRLYPAGELAGVAVPNPSSVVLAATGTGSVAEAAAVRAAGEFAGGGEGEPGQVELAVPKLSADGVTVAAARITPRGRLCVVGLGPGPADLRTPRAEAELRRACAVVGSAQDVDGVRDLLHPGAATVVAGSDDARVETAVSLARAGRLTALVGPGDADVLRAKVGAAGHALEVHMIPGLPL